MKKIILSLVILFLAANVCYAQFPIPETTVTELNTLAADWKSLAKNFGNISERASNLFFWIAIQESRYLKAINTMLTIEICHINKGQKNKMAVFNLNLYIKKVLEFIKIDLDGLLKRIPTIENDSIYRYAIEIRDKLKVTSIFLEKLKGELGDYASTIK